MLVLASLLSTPAIARAQRLTHPSGRILRTITSDGHLYGVTIDRRRIVYVSKVHANELLRVPFDATSPPVVAPIGEQPPHLVVDEDGTSLFATLQQGRAVVRIAARTGATLDSVPLGGDGFNLALDPDGAHLVATAGHGWAYQLTREPLALVDSLFVGTSPNGVAYSPQGGIVYVSSRDAGSVTAIDTRTFRQITRWNTGGSLQRIALTPDGRTLFAADEGEGGGLVRIDVRIGTISHIPLGGTPYGLGITPDGRQLWVLLLDRGVVAVRTLPDLRLIRSIDVGGRPRNIAFTHRGDGAAVTTESAVVLIR